MVLKTTYPTAFMIVILKSGRKKYTKYNFELHVPYALPENIVSAIDVVLFLATGVDKSCTFQSLGNYLSKKENADKMLRKQRTPFQGYMLFFFFKFSFNLPSRSGPKTEDTLAGFFFKFSFLQLQPIRSSTRSGPKQRTPQA